MPLWCGTSLQPARFSNAASVLCFNHAFFPLLWSDYLALFYLCFFFMLAVPYGLFKKLPLVDYMLLPCFIYASFYFLWSHYLGLFYLNTNQTYNMHANWYSLALPAFSMCYLKCSVYFVGDSNTFYKGKMWSLDDKSIMPEHHKVAGTPHPFPLHG